MAVESIDVQEEDDLNTIHDLDGVDGFGSVDDLGISWGDITNAVSNPMSAAEDGARVGASTVIKRPDMQKKLYDIGRTIGKNIAGVLQNSVTNFFINPPPMPPPGPTSGTWETDVLQPMIPPILAGIKDEITPYLKFTGVAATGLLVLSHAFTFVLARSLGSKCKTPASPLSGLAEVSHRRIARRATNTNTRRRS